MPSGRWIVNNSRKIITFVLAGLLSLAVLWTGTDTYAQSAKSDVEAMIAAAGAGDLKAVKAAIEGGIPVDAKDSLGVTALMEASFAGQLRVVEFLLGKSANANAKDEAGTSPLSEALGKDHADIALALIKAGADPNIRDSKDYSVLYRAVELGHEDLLTEAIRKGAEVHPLNLAEKGKDSFYNPLKLAVEKNDLAAAKALIAAGADPNRPNVVRVLYKPLSIAATAKNGKMVQLLLDAGARSNGIVLAYAAEEDLKLLKKLLKDPASREPHALGFALQAAVESRNNKAINALIQSGADVNGSSRGWGFTGASDYAFVTSLVTAVKAGDAKIVRLLIRAGANASRTAPLIGLQPITYAAQSGRADLVKLLTGAGANLEKAMEELYFSRPDELKNLTWDEWVGSPEWSGPTRLLIKFGAPVESAIKSAVQAGNSALVREWLPLIKNWGVPEGRVFQTSEIYFSLVEFADSAENCAMVREIKRMFQRRTGLKPPQGAYFPKCK